MGLYSPNKKLINKQIKKLIYYDVAISKVVLCPSPDIFQVSALFSPVLLLL